MALPHSPFVGHSEIEVVHHVDFVLRKELNIATDFVSNVYRLAIPKNTAIVSVRLRVKTPSNGTAPTVAVADSAGLAYLGTNDLDPSSAAGTQKNSLIAGETGAHGFFYSAASLLVVTLAGTAAPTTGVLVLEVVFSGGIDKPKDMINNF